MFLTNENRTGIVADVVEVVVVTAAMVFVVVVVVVESATATPSMSMSMGVLDSCPGPAKGVSADAAVVDIVT